MRLEKFGVVPMDQKTGTTAIAAIAAAVISIIATFSGHAVIGLLVALVSLPLGALGMAMAVSPRVSGGMLSIGAIVLGIFGIGIAVLGMLGHVLF
jgi:hypothetical protein